MSEREDLVSAALAWQGRFGCAPAITSAISEHDAALLVGHDDASYAHDCVNRTAVSQGYDFTLGRLRYQVKANRPSGKPGSFVTLVAKARNYDWDRLVWILYDREYVLLEAWEWNVDAYRASFDGKKRLSPRDMRSGRRLFPYAEKSAA